MRADLYYVYRAGRYGLRFQFGSKANMERLKTDLDKLAPTSTTQIRTVKIKESRMKPHDLQDEHGQHLAHVQPADTMDVVDMLALHEDRDGRGRSPWVWVTLANGDLMLATFPQGDDYERFAQKVNAS